MKRILVTLSIVMFISLSLAHNYRSTTASSFASALAVRSMLATPTSSHAQDPKPRPEEATPTPTPKSNRELCIEADPGACVNYARELEKECGDAPTMASQPTQRDYEANSKWLTCKRRAQCWKDRAISLTAVEDLCRAGEDKPECVEAKYRSKKIDPEMCDKPKENTF